MLAKLRKESEVIAHHHEEERLKGIDSRLDETKTET